MSRSRWVPGLRFGPEFDPEQYELLEFHHRGGEAEVWRAVRTGHSGIRELVAAKIMLERDPSEVRRWLGRWDDVSHNAHRLGITDLVVPSFMLGPAPHRPGLPSGTEMLGYQIAPWVSGVPLHQWAKDHRGGLVEVGAVLVRLCRIVDELHRQRWVHRDISPANVLVDADGDVKLIDLTFLAPLDHALTVAVFTPGHVPPEAEVVGRFPSVAKDVFAVGTLARALLLPEYGRLDNRLAAEQARRELIEAGFGEELADWACEPLDENPDARPSPMVPWAARGGELLREHRTLPRVSCLAVAVDGDGRPMAVSGGVEGLSFAGPGFARHELPPGQGPRAVRNVVVGRVGAQGDLGMFVEDANGALWAGNASGWWEAARGISGIAGDVDKSGELVVWAASDGLLRSFRWPQAHTHTGSSLPRCPADRVVAAVEERAGVWLVLVEYKGQLCCWRVGVKTPLEHVGAPGPVLGAAVARSSAGPQTTVLRQDGTVQLHVLNGGSPSNSAGSSAVGATNGEIGEAEVAHSVAMAGHRGGPSIAVAGAGGVRLRIPGTGKTFRWWRPTLRPATKVALSIGADWRMCLAAVVEDELYLWQEDAAYRWQPVSLDPE
jgi:eukaryotic-like serine/threonine-protein kinase